MSIAALKVCAQCAHMNPPDALFCNQCGKSIAQAAEREHYTPRHLSEKILKMRSAMEGERKQVTVLFVDIKGSVALSRQVEAERWHQIMDRFFGLLSDAVHDYEGTINQYTGDGVMALFGAPIAHEDHASRACRAALAIRHNLIELASELKQQDGLDFAARQGLNSGEVVVGRIGDDLRMDYTAQGQTVGLAARMEQLAAANGILLSAYTRDLVPGEFEFKERSSLTVKGYPERIHTYQLLATAKNNLSGRGDYALVGRDRELKQLEAYRESAQHNARGLLITIKAETGQGKSRLCREFIARTQAQGIPSYAIRGSSHHRVEPEEPLREFFRSFLDLPASDEADGVLQMRLEQALQPYQPLPEALQENLYALFGIHHSGKLLAEFHRRVELALELLMRLLHDGALQQHAVFVIENIHWLDDPSTAAFFDAVFAMIPHAPVLMVVTARPDYIPRWQARPYARDLPLRSLSVADSLLLLAQMLGHHPELDGLKHDIAERAGGNAMFMQELVRQLVNSGVLSKEPGAARLKRTPEGISLPPSVQAVVAARIDSLSESCKSLLQTAAVMGRRVRLALLREVHAQADFDAALAELVEQGFLYHDEVTDTSDTLLFSQTLFQSVAYDALLSEQRQELHARVAQAISRLYPNLPGMSVHLARHLDGAGQYQQAAQCYLASAQGIARRDLGEAVRRLQLAADLLEVQHEAQLNSRPEAEDWLDLRLEILARMLQYAVRLPDHGLDFYELLEQGQEWLEQGVAAYAESLFWIARGTVQLTLGELPQAMQDYRRAEQLAATLGHPGMQIGVQVPLCYGLYVQGDLAATLEQIDAALSLAQQTDAGSSSAYALGYEPVVTLQVLKAWTCLWTGQIDLSRKVLVGALERAQAERHAEQVVSALAASAYLEAESGAPGLAQKQAEQALRIAQGMENIVAQLLSLAAMGRALLRGYHWAEAISHLEDALSRVGGWSFGMGEVARLQMDLSVAFLGAGNPRQAREAADRAVDLARDSGSRLLMAEAQLAQIRAGLFSSRPLGFLKRYRSALDDISAVIESSQAYLLEPECMLLQVRWLRLRDQFDQAAGLELRAEQRLKQLGLATPWASVLLHSEHVATGQY